ncbi:MAG: Crp/Fnr family transcriptional regulator [Eubacteriaceae bacterium]
MENKFALLRKNKLFEDVHENLEEMLKCLGSEEKHYSKDEIIFLAGSPIHSLGILLEGELQIIQNDYMGNRSIVDSLYPGHIFGETIACAGLEESPVTVLATKHSKVFFLKIQRIISTCPNSCPFHQQLIENLLKILAQKNILLNHKNQLLSQRSIRDKIMAYLSDQSDKKGTRAFKIPFSRNELADFLCVDRSALSRVLSQLKNEKIIDFHKESFTIL